MCISTDILNLRYYKKIITRSLFCLMLLAIMASTDASNNINTGSSKNAFLVGIIPQQSAKKITLLWQPLLGYLSQKTGYSFQLHGTPDIPSFEKHLLAGKFDIVYTNPRLYIESQRHVGYEPIVKESNKKLVGIILVRKDSSINTVYDLQNKSFVSPAHAFAASIVPELNLISMGIKVKNFYVSTHDQGYALVVQKKIDAAGGVFRTFAITSPAIRKQLKILWQSPGLTPHAFAIHPRISRVIAQKITNALVNMHQDKKGKKILQALNMNPLIKAKDTDWDDVRKLMAK